ncbi:hypothetical protein [Bifidobacterium felsineum]|uniref:hypothetical protein n=1 Tax=Bifidobacterium felsineum TaxID=2045440 RepID=UPI001BDC0F6A|nr:hypothetical protein [Bifidobacterium felsineum]MBT1164628.1 hypothetical protein [Bifidobacterium felsineum]
MNDYWLGVITPFAITLGVLLIWTAINLLGALVSWAWKKAHHGLLKKVVLSVGWDEEEQRPSVRPEAERLAKALTASGEFRMFPLFGWVVIITRDHRKPDKKIREEKS